MSALAGHVPDGDVQAALPTEKDGYEFLTAGSAEEGLDLLELYSVDCILMDLVLGVVGAIVGGFLFNLIGHSAPTGINLYSIFVATIGAIVVLVLYHMVIRRRV